MNKKNYLIIFLVFIVVICICSISIILIINNQNMSESEKFKKALIENEEYKQYENDSDELYNISLGKYENIKEIDSDTLLVYNSVSFYNYTYNEFLKSTKDFYSLFSYNYLDDNTKYVLKDYKNNNYNEITYYNSTGNLVCRSIINGLESTNCDSDSQNMLLLAKNKKEDFLHLLKDNNISYNKLKNEILN